jgi:hypothetical protein
LLKKAQLKSAEADLPARHTAVVRLADEARARGRVVMRDVANRSEAKK